MPNGRYSLLPPRAPTTCHTNTFDTSTTQMPLFAQQARCSAAYLAADVTSCHRRSAIIHAAELGHLLAAVGGHVSTLPVVFHCLRRGADLGAARHEVVGRHGAAQLLLRLEHGLAGLLREVIAS